jgi:titin
VTLNWTAPAFNGGSVIDYYVVYRDGVDVAHPAITTVSITGLTNGQAYSFTVAVHNAAGLGAQSGAVSSMPFTVPNSPTGLTAIPNNAQVTLNWTAPAFDGGSVITGYRVYRSTTETGTYSLIASPSGTNYTDAGRINGQTYWYNVSAVNAAGEGIKTALVASVPFTVPNSPTGLTATPGNGLIDLNWTVPSYVGIGSITYNVFRDGIAIYNGPEMNYRDSGLAKGALHSYTVAARNSAGWGLNCTAAHSAATGVPDAPRGLTAAAGDRRVDLNWTVPSYLGPGTLAYHLFRNGSLIWSGSEIIYTDTNVTNGFSYTYNVAASNSLGWGGNSSIALTAPIGPPSEPTGMTAIAGDERVNLTWTVPAYWGPGGITYHLFRDGGEIWSGTVTSYNDTSLINGITYAYSVSASNPLGWGPNSTAVLATPFGVPDAPWGLSAISGNAQASLSWNSVNYSGPGTLTYHLFRDGVEVWSGTAIYYEDAGLSNGQAYEYTLAASNSIGWSLNSSSVSVTPQGPPSYPRGLVAEAGNGVAELNWTTPSYSGPGVLIYHLFRDGVEVWNGTELGYVDASLTNFVSYSYAVAAQNSIGWGPNSTAVQATPLPSEMRPTSPRNLVAMPGNENVTMTWDPPEYSNSSAVSGYMISFGTSPGSMSNQITWNQLVYVLDGLAKGQTYYFKVSAQNSAGWGPNSSVTSAIPFGIPDTPRGLDAVPGNAQVVLNWSAPSYTGPWTVTYRLFRDQVMVWSGTAISHTDSGLTNGQEYTYQISAGNSVGWGPNTTSMTATPLAPPMPPGVPTRFHVVEGDGQVILNWTAPSQSGSSPLTGYKLYRSNTYGSTYILIAVPSGLTYTDAGLTNGQTYLYKVSAVNAVGEGVQCSVVSAAPQGATTDNTIPYVGIAIAAIVGIAIVVELMSRRK